jgi:nitrogen fixation/metabolism regulation signal transduction histidine kinase
MINQPISYGLLRTVAEKQLASQKLWIEPPENLDQLKLIHELQVHQIELQIQTEVLRESNARAEVLRSKYQDLFELAPVGYMTLSKRGTIFEANKCAASLFNQKPHALVGRKLREFVKESCVASIDSFLDAAEKSMIDISLRDIELLSAKPFPRFVNLQAHAIASDPSGEEKIRLVMMDVSALKASTDDVVLAMDRASGFSALE